MKPIVIVFEGIDGSGKSYLANTLVSRYRSMKLNVEYVHFPQENETYGKIIYGHLRDTKDFNTINPLAQWMLYALDRNQYFSSNNLEDKILIMDRYATSSLIYQTSSLIYKYADLMNKTVDEVLNDDYDYLLIGENVSFRINKWIEMLQDAEYGVLNIPKPDIVFYINSPNRSFKVLNERTQHDNFESNKKFMQICSVVGNELCNSLGWYHINNDENQEIETFDRICSILEDKDNSILKWVSYLA